MGADSEHDEPLGLLDAVGVELGVAEGGDVERLRLCDLGGGAVADEDGLAAPFDNDVLSHRDFAEVHFHFGHGENVGGGGHVDEEVCWTGGLANLIYMLTTFRLIGGRGGEVGPSCPLQGRRGLNCTQLPLSTKNLFQLPFTTPLHPHPSRIASNQSKRNPPCTVTFAPAALNTPIVPAIKYPNNLFPSLLPELLYFVKSGILVVLPALANGLLYPSPAAVELGRHCNGAAVATAGNSVRDGRVRSVLAMGVNAFFIVVVGVVVSVYVWAG